MGFSTFFGYVLVFALPIVLLGLVSSLVLNGTNHESESLDNKPYVYWIDMMLHDTLSVVFIIFAVIGFGYFAHYVYLKGF